MTLVAENLPHVLQQPVHLQRPRWRTVDIMCVCVHMCKRVCVCVCVCVCVDRLCGLVLVTDPDVRVRFPALSDVLRSSESGTGSTQPR
jgi:hypothetical protein